jgi:hypothetical protein
MAKVSCRKFQIPDFILICLEAVFGWRESAELLRRAQAVDQAEDERKRSRRMWR